MFSVKHRKKYVRRNVRHLKPIKSRKGRKGKSFFHAINGSWKDFCSTSSFVGFRYIYHKNRTIIDVIMGNEDLQQTVNITKFVEIFNLKADKDPITLSNAGRVFAEYNLTMRDMLNLTSHSCEEVFTVCRWAGSMIPCTMVFKKTLAVGGFCCSFNYPVSLENTIRKKWLKTNTFGLKGGLSFAFKTIVDEDYYFKIDYGNTLRVVIHPPHTVPTFNENDLLISKSKETAIKITMVYNTADEKVKQLPIEYRDCSFGFEKQLKYFVRYTNKNCLVECRMDRVINNCGCISYYFPSDGIDVCPTEKFHCSFKNRQVAKGVRQGTGKIYTEVSDCDCPDDCQLAKHYTKINSWKLSTYGNHSVDEFYSKVTSDHGVVHISYAKSTSMRLNRKLSFDEIGLASNFGGIIALFLGCSFISVIELTYFLIIRTLKFYHAKI